MKIVETSKIVIIRASHDDLDRVQSDKQSCLVPSAESKTDFPCLSSFLFGFF